MPRPVVHGIWQLVRVVRRVERKMCGQLLADSGDSLDKSCREIPFVKLVSDSVRDGVPEVLAKLFMDAAVAAASVIVFENVPSFIVSLVSRV